MSGVWRSGRDHAHARYPPETAARGHHHHHHGRGGVDAQGTLQQQQEEGDSLLVFGYQCKIFRDDEKAMFIERKKHLIPWMGDASLMIDRSADKSAVYE